MSTNARVRYGAHENYGRASIFVDPDGNLAIEGNVIYDTGKSGVPFRITLHKSSELWGSLLEVSRTGFDDMLAAGRGDSKQRKSVPQTVEKSLVFTRSGVCHLTNRPNEHDDILPPIPYDPLGEVLLVRSDGKGFRWSQSELEGSQGKAVVDMKGQHASDARLAVARSIRPTDTHVAIVGENRKLLVLPLDALPAQKSGKGVTLQKYKAGSLSDALTFNWDAGLAWRDPAGRPRVVSPEEWLGKKASSGRIAPRGFPRDNRFS
jgi:hypothetical protein